MEQTETYRLKLEKLSKAFSSFSQSLEVEFSGKSDIEIDVLRNGQVQKFETCIELVWKMIKTYLYDYHGIECYSPKSCLKAFYQNSSLSEQDYESVMDMIVCRNAVAHIYEEEEFEAIYQKLTMFTPVINRCLTILDAAL
ncbi:hypothetical protein EH223_06410 [candidate division KSB1 bacterium]|nr:MAG: hypothetical protein EH223_06410 [candidate division KSB1 bacterium]